ncbi:MAG: signal peptidase II [Ancrocorticia sp.]|uniref:signal peptidase II n=1 Tax=Ancrocorticia sp. TaxID=2593684 RepID=UPI003F907B9D
MSSTKKRLGWAGAVAVLVILIDLLSKQWALSTLDDGRRIDVLGDFFGFKLYFNPGAAFSLGADSTLIFTVIASAVVIAMPFIIRRIASMPWAISLGLVWGGAAGNLIDRLFRDPGIGHGHVIDFMAYADWFIGNVADAALVIGVVLLAILSFRDVPSSDSSTAIDIDDDGDVAEAAGGETND